MTQIGKNYADALYSLMKEDGVSEAGLNQLKQVRDLFRENPDYLRLLGAPNVPLAERLGLLDEALAGQVHPYVLNLLKLLCERGHIQEFRSCFVRYRADYMKDNGILEATAVTAVPLRAEQAERISQKLRALTGQRVDVFNRVDPSVLGGIRLEFDGRELDGTVRRRLDGIEKTLSETVL